VVWAPSWTPRSTASVSWVYTRPDGPDDVLAPCRPSVNAPWSRTRFTPPGSSNEARRSRSTSGAKVTPVAPRLHGRLTRIWSRPSFDQHASANLDPPWVAIHRRCRARARSVVDRSRSRLPKKGSATRWESRGLEGAWKSRWAHVACALAEARGRGRVGWGGSVWVEQTWNTRAGLEQSPAAAQARPFTGPPGAGSKARSPPQAHRTRSRARRARPAPAAR
jgi:hypothetical protein